MSNPSKVGHCMWKEAPWRVILLLLHLIKAASTSLWKYGDFFFSFFFLTSRFSVHEKKEGNNLFFLSLDELLLMSNYLTTIDGALVSNSAAAVQNKEEPDLELGEEVRGSTAPHGRQSHGVHADGSTALTCGLSTWHHRHELIHWSFFFFLLAAADDYKLQELPIRRPFKAAKWRRFKVVHSRDKKLDFFFYLYHFK